MANALKRWKPGLHSTRDQGRYCTLPPRFLFYDGGYVNMREKESMTEQENFLIEQGYVTGEIKKLNDHGSWSTPT